PGPRLASGPGVEVLGDKVDRIYVNTLAVPLLEITPQSVLALFQDENVAKSFELAWRSEKPAYFSDEVFHSLGELAVGDSIKKHGLDLAGPLARFQYVF